MHGGGKSILYLLPMANSFHSFEYDQVIWDTSQVFKFENVYSAVDWMRKFPTKGSLIHRQQQHTEQQSHKFCF